MFILVPVFYLAIFKFRKVQDLTAGIYKRLQKWANENPMPGITLFVKPHIKISKKRNKQTKVSAKKQTNKQRYQRDWKEKKEGEQPVHHQDQLHCLVARGLFYQKRIKMSSKHLKEHWRELICGCHFCAALAALYQPLVIGSSTLRFQTTGVWPALRISFDDISFCNYRVFFKILLKYRYRIFF